MACTTFRTLIGAAALCLTGAAYAQQDAYDIVIRNGRVIDGTGNGWFHADVALKDGKIAAIGDLSNAEAARELDATDRFVAPGFIDVHTHSDDGLYEQPEAANFLRNGVTTIISGNCGGSVLDVEYFFTRLKETGLGPNSATLVGHNTILRNAKGLAAGALTDEQWEKARAFVRKAMEDGAVGLSTGLIYDPGTWSDTEEIIELQKVASEYGGIYVSHIRGEGAGILDSIDEALRIGRETNSRVQISHFKLPTLVAASIGGSDVTLQKVYDARSAGQEVWLDQYPYTASSTTMNTLLPKWVREEGPEAAKETIQNPEKREKIMADMTEDFKSRDDLSYAVITTSRAYPDFTGLNVKEVAQVLKLRKEKGEDVDWKSARKNGELPEVTKDEQFEAVLDIYLKGGAGGVFHSMDEKEVSNIMRSPIVAIASDSGVRTFGEGHPHPRGYGTNARVLGEYVRTRGIIGWEEAIRKMSSLPALAFRFEKRGLLREGYWGDVVVFDPETITDNATYDNPHNYSTGFDYVLVNGVIVVEKDELTGELPGMPIHGPGTVHREAEVAAK